MICETSALGFNSFLPRAGFMGLLCAVSSCFEHLWNCPPSSQTLQDFPLRVGLGKEPVFSWLMQTHLVSLIETALGWNQPILYLLSDPNLSPRQGPRREMREWKTFPPEQRKRPEQGARELLQCSGWKGAWWHSQSTEPAEFLLDSMEKLPGSLRESIGNAREGHSEEQFPTGYTQNCCFQIFFSVYRDIKPLLEHLNPTFLLLPLK